MLLQSSVKGTIGHVADSVLLGRDSNRDPDRYRANSIHDSNNDTYWMHELRTMFPYGFHMTR